MHKRLFLILAVAAIFGPVGQSDAQETAEPERLARGLMLFHEGRMIFSPCRERNYVEVQDDSPDGVVTTALRGLGLAQDRPLYAEVHGEAVGGSLRMTGLNFAHVQARCGGARDGTGPWLAVGRDPAWSFVTTPERLRLHVAGQVTTESAFSETRGDPSVITLSTEVGPAQWELRREPCYQLEDGLVAGWSVKGSAGGKVLSGCAWKP
jgi:putative lipoprotein